MDEDAKSNVKKSIPVTTSYKIIIPADLTTFEFNRNTYKEQKLSEYITKKDYDDIVNNASKIMYKSWLTKKNNDTFNQPQLFMNFAFKTSALLILYIVSLFIATLVDSFIVIFVSCGLFGGGIVLMIFLSLLNIKKPLIQFKTLDEILEQELGSYLEEINKKYTETLNFKFNNENYYMECIILSKFSKEDEEGKKVIEIQEENEENEKENANNEHEENSKANKQKKLIEEDQPLVNDLNSNNKSIRTNRKDGESTNLIDNDRSNIDLNPKQIIELIDMNKG
jgi:hypothetical protein